MHSNLSYKISTIILFILLFNNCYCQFIVDIGPDTTHCMYPYVDTIYIAPNLTVTGGTEPYTYKWECIDSVAPGLILWASSYLNDTTLANPFFINRFTGKKWFKFILNVWDDNDNYVKDSIKIRFSEFVYIGFGYNAYLNPGDSIQFFLESLIGGGIAPLLTCYTPEYGLSDPCSLMTWCKPDSTTFYYQVATDSVGCISDKILVYKIFVNGLDIKKLTQYPQEPGVYQFGDRVIFDNPYNKKANIKMYSIKGSLLYETENYNNYVLTTDMQLNQGIYIIIIKIENIILSGKIYY